MKTKTTEERLAGGVDQRWKAQNNLASDIRNCRVEDVGLGWKNDRGWENLIPVHDNMTRTFTPAELENVSNPVRFLKVWTRHGGSEVYYLYERNGKLMYHFGNQGAASEREVILESGRNIPKADDPGTQLTPFGRFALVQNGYEAPFKFWGRVHQSPFGWTMAPNPPVVYDVNLDEIDTPQHMEAGQGSYVTSWRSVGLGNTDNGDWSHYRYKVSFVSDTGSESPLSDGQATTWKVENTDQDNFKAGIVLDDIPTGDSNVVARRIYRTKNLENNAAEKYYFCKQLNDNTTKTYVDIIPDSLMLEEAPAKTDSILINQSFKYAATYNGCIWVAGGDDFSTNIRYSDRHLPEQFDAFRFFDVGMRQGGEITALVPYSNSLLVFRAGSIEVISAISDDTYTIGTLDSDIGTRATNTIKEVPGVGLFFLTKDGVYAIQGGQSGAGLVTAKVESVSAGLYGEWKRLSEGSLARATATYSTMEKEYWVHYPCDGETENTRGAVFHRDIQQWSLRNLSDGVSVTSHTGTNTNYQMAFTCLDSDPEGWIVIGTYPDYPYAAAGAVANQDKTFFPGFDLQVWSANCQWGVTGRRTSETAQAISYSLHDQAKATDDCAWISTWDDFGDDSIKKRIHSVEIEMVSQGYNDLVMTYASDYTFSTLTGGTAAPMIIEKYYTLASEPVWTITSGNPNVKNLAIWGENWSNGQLCRVRFDVHTGLVSHFQWGIQSANPFHIISYNVEYSSSDQKVITRRGGSGS
jgi:hypothetical protein